MLITDADRQRVCELTKALIRLESDAMLGHEGAVGQWLYRFFAELDVPVELQECAPGRWNVIATLPGRRADRTILYSGHMDTVPLGDPSRWTSPATQPEVRDGRLYGRGACDMKGSIACTLAMAEIITRRAILPESTVRLVHDVDEENRNLGLHTYLQHAEPANLVLVGEPTSLRMAVGHRGVMAFTVHVQGRSAHVGQAEQGNNALYAAADVIARVRALQSTLAATRQPYLGSPSLHVTQLHGGEKVNVIPEEAVLRLDRRLVGTENAESCEAQLDALLKQSEMATGCAMRRETTTYCPPGYTGPEQPEARRVAEMLKDMGLPAEPVAFEASCEAGLLHERLGVPVLILGPGSIRQAHQPDEYVETDQLACGLALYLRLFTTL